MSTRSASPASVVVVIACAAVCAVAAGVCWYQWNRWSDMNAARALLDQDPNAGPAAPGEADTLAARQAALAGQLAERTRELARLRDGAMPTDDEAVKRQILALLDTAAGCGLVVEEVRRISNDAQSTSLSGRGGTAHSSRSGNREAVAAFLNRFSTGSAPRPLVQLRCRGGYATVREYFTRLCSLQWKVTPVLFEINRGGPIVRTTFYEEEDAATTPATEPDELQLSIIVSL